VDSRRCHIDSQPHHWFRCALGTKGCPIIHDGVEPYCIACREGECLLHERKKAGMTITLGRIKVGYGRGCVMVFDQKARKGFVRPRISPDGKRRWTRRSWERARAQHS